MAREVRQDARVSFGCLYNAGCRSWLLLPEQQFPFLKQICKWVGFIVSGRGRTLQWNQPNQTTFPPQPMGRGLGKELPAALSGKVRGACWWWGWGRWWTWICLHKAPWHLDQGWLLQVSELMSICPCALRLIGLWSRALLPGGMWVPRQIGIPWSCPGCRVVISLLTAGITSDVGCWVKPEGGEQYCKALCFVAA